MAQQQTLAEAKKALADEEAKLQVPEKQVEPAKTEPDKPTETPATAESKEGESPEEWMRDESSETPATSGNSDKKVPVDVLVGTRKKFQARIAEKDAALSTTQTENEQLKARLAELEKQVLRPKVADIPAAAAKEPDPLDYADPAQYRAAKQRYDDARLDERLRVREQAAEAKRRQEQERAALEKSVDSHYDRVAKLCEEHKLDPTSYSNNELAVRKAIDLAFPGGADVITDQLIANLGEGSEKVVWYLGRNEAARNELVRRLLSDKSGLQASIYLGEIKASKASTPTAGKKTMAPSPAARVSGDGGGGMVNDKLEQKYSDAQKKGDIQAMFNIRKQAKAQGIDVRQWG